MLTLVIFYLSLLVGAYFALFSYASLAFVVYQLIYFYNPADRWWGSTVPDLPYSFMSVIFMMAIFMKGWSRFTKNKLLAVPQIKWMYFLVILYSITSLFAVYPEYHASQLEPFIKLSIIFSIAYKLIDTEKDLDFALLGYIFGSWYIGFLTYQVGRNSGNRVEGIGTVDSPDSNGIAAAIAPSLVLCLYFLWSKEGLKYKLLFLMAMAFIANALVLINSRGAMLAVIFSVAYFLFSLFFSSVKKRFQKLTVIIFILFAMAGAYKIADDSFLDRLSGIIEQTNVDKSQESGGTRVYYWLAAIDMAQDYPFGNGVRGFNYFAPIYLDEELNTGRSNNRSVHSSWFEALSEVGYLGLFFLLMILYSSFRGMKRCKIKLRTDQDFTGYYKIVAIEASLIAYMITMTFLNRTRAEVLYWLILFTAAAYNIYVLKNQETIKNKELSG